MANFSKDYKTLYKTASDSADTAQMNRLFDELMNEIDASGDPTGEAAQVAAGRRTAELQNAQFRNDSGKKI